MPIDAWLNTGVIAVSLSFILWLLARSDLP